MEEIFGAIFEILAELLFQVVAQWLASLVAEGVFRVAASMIESVRFAATWRLVGAAAFGALVGWASLLVAPKHIIPSEALRFVSLTISPVVAGAVMAALGKRQIRREQPRTALHYFFSGWLFALGMALVRFFFAGH